MQRCPTEVLGVVEVAEVAEAVDKTAEVTGVNKDAAEVAVSRLEAVVKTEVAVKVREEVTLAIRVPAMQMGPHLKFALSTGFMGNPLTGVRSQLPVHGGTITYLNRTINEIQQDSTIKMTQKKFRDYFMAMVLKKFKK